MSDKIVPLHLVQSSTATPRYRTTKARPKLAESAIPLDVARTAGMTPVDSARTLDPSFFPVPALAIPYPELCPTANGSRFALLEPDPAPFIRVRYLTDPPPATREGKPVRYQQPTSSGVHLYAPLTDAFPDWAPVFADPAYLVLITEGELKALSAQHNLGHPCLGLGGVTMWHDAGTRDLHPTLQALAIPGRQFLIIDSLLRATAASEQVL